MPAAAPAPAPEGRPERQPETTGVSNLNLLDAVPGLRLCDRDWRALASMRHPVKVALWMALMRPSEELFSRESLIETTPNPEGGGYEAKSIPAILAWSETVVRRAIRGDPQASHMIADRIEGKIGTRKDEEDPEDLRRRGDMQSVIEAVVAGLVTAKLTAGDQADDSIDITAQITPVDVSPHESMDRERQDSDTARRAEMMREQRREQEDGQRRGESLVDTNQAPEERDLSDPAEGPRIVAPNGRANGHGP